MGASVGLIERTVITFNSRHWISFWVCPRYFTGYLKCEINQASCILFAKCSYPIPQNRVRSPKRHISKGDDKRHFEGAFKTLRCCGHQPQVPYLPNSSEKFKGRDEKHLKTVFQDVFQLKHGVPQKETWGSWKGHLGPEKQSSGSVKATGTNQVRLCMLTAPALEKLT